MQKEKEVPSVPSKAKNEVDSLAINTVRLGFMDLSRKQTESAINQFREALKVSANLPDAYFGLALTSNNWDDKKLYLKELYAHSIETCPSEKEYITQDTAYDCLLLYIDCFHEGRIRYIMAHFPDICKNDYPPLSYAIAQGNVEATHTLIASGADVNKPRVSIINGNKNEFSPLSDAIWRAKNVDIVRMLIAAGADTARVENWLFDNGIKEKIPMLSIAINHSKNEKIVRALIDAGADINQHRLYTANSKTTAHLPLADAIWTANNADMVRWLIDAGAEINRSYQFYDAKDDTDNEIPMLSVAVYGAKNKEMVRMLIGAGADVNQPRLCSVNGKTAQYPALSDAICYAKNSDIVQILIDAGADINQPRHIYNCGRVEEHSPLSDAVWSANNTRMVRMLIDAGAEVNKIEYCYRSYIVKDELSTLAYAVFLAKDINMIRELVNAGAKWDQVVAYRGIRKNLSHFPLKKLGYSRKYIEELKQLGYKAPLF